MTVSLRHNPVLSSRSDFIVPSSAYVVYSVKDFCDKLEQNAAMSSAKIVSSVRYGDKNGVPHRFLMLRGQQHGVPDFYIRLDRRPDHRVPSWKLWFNSSAQPAKDTVRGLPNRTSRLAEVVAITGGNFTKPGPLVR